MANSTATDTTTCLTDPVALLSEFFTEPEIAKRFDIINDRQISGWENWLQIEFAYFLSKHITDDKGQWWREYKIRWDELPDGEYVKPDFWLWSGAEHHYHLIEFKQSWFDSDAALKGTEEDIAKLSSLGVGRNFKEIGDTTEFTCASKAFVLVSKNERPSQTLGDALMVASGKVEDSGWCWATYQ